MSFLLFYSPLPSSLVVLFTCLETSPFCLYQALKTSSGTLVGLMSSSSSSNVNHLSQPCIYGHIVSSHAERKSSFMKWLTKLFKAGAENRELGTWRRNPQSSGDGTTVSHGPVRPLDDKEREDLDRAIELSRADDPNKSYGYRWTTDLDEDLARRLHDSLNFDPFPRDYQPRNFRVCSGCKREIGYGNYLGVMGMFYHQQCFRCRACGRTITEREFSSSGRNAYHKLCFRELTHPKCDVCHQFIPLNGAGLIEYRCHPFWSQKYCPSHECDNTARCCSCERLESRNARYISLGDGRSICFECMESAIMDTGDCQPLYHAIRDYYEGLNMKIEQQIPMLLVERQALNEAIEGEKHGVRHMPETRGLCLSEEQTVVSVLRRPRFASGGLVGMRTQPQKLRRRCEVTAILVLYGLPRLLTGAILAHELMHGWLRLNGFRNLKPDVEEGICQVLSHMWLESEVISVRNMPSSSSSSSKKGRRSSAENKLGEFFMHQIANDTSPAYGVGYRAAAAAVDKYDLRRTLDHIRFTRVLPE